MQGLEADPLDLPTELSVGLPQTPYGADCPTFLWKEAGGRASIPSPLICSAEEVVRRLRSVAEGIERQLAARQGEGVADSRSESGRALAPRMHRLRAAG